MLSINPLNIVTAISSKNNAIFTSLPYIWDSWQGGSVSTWTWGCRSGAWGSLVKPALCIVSLGTCVGFPGGCMCDVMEYLHWHHPRVFVVFQESANNSSLLLYKIKTHYFLNNTPSPESMSNKSNKAYLKQSLSWRWWPVACWTCRCMSVSRGRLVTPTHYHMTGTPWLSRTVKAELELSLALLESLVLPSSFQSLRP